MTPAISHRALVTYSNENTGEIRVKIPAVTGVNTEISLSKIGRAAINKIWVVPVVGEQIIVSADDDNMTNVFWIQTDQLGSHTHHLRNFAQFIYTGSVVAPTVAPTSVPFDTQSTTEYQQGIRLTNASTGEITFDYEGYYNLQFSIQFTNANANTQNVALWVDYNGFAYTNSSTYLSVPSKHGTDIRGSAVMSVNLMGKASVGGKLKLKWYATSADVSLTTYTPLFDGNHGKPLSPVTAPAAIVTITQVR